MKMSLSRYSFNNLITRVMSVHTIYFGLGQFMLKANFFLFQAAVSCWSK